MKLIMKLNLLASTNLEAVLKASVEKHRGVTDVLSQVKSLLKQTRFDSTNQFDVDQLESANIFSLEEIKTICIDYRLRFLDLKYFKGQLPQEAKNKINALEETHQTQLNMKLLEKPYQIPLFCTNKQIS